MLQVFQATIVIPGAGGLMGDLVGRGDAPNKKMAEKMAALDACVKLAQVSSCPCRCGCGCGCGCKYVMIIRVVGGGVVLWFSVQ